MKKSRKGILPVALILLLTAFSVTAQEFTAPLQQNPYLKGKKRSKNGMQQKPTALALPFFEDFTDYEVFPSSEKWQDNYVYVNNTMAVNPISRGVATFDGLNAKGEPYDSLVAYNIVNADSLTSQAIDLSTVQPSDSVYLSFFYEPKGHGFAPKAADSFMLFMHKSNGEWVKVWSAATDTSNQFRQAIIPVTDTAYFNNNFRIRWVNKATMGISNSHWHLDYIRLDAGRTYNDTTIQSDWAFTDGPYSILNDFTVMPFRHFKTNPASFLAANLNLTLRPNYSPQPSANYNLNYRATVSGSGTLLGSGSTSGSLPAQINTSVLLPMYNAGSYNAPNPNDRVVFDHVFTNQDVQIAANDTCRYQQIFDSYFAYDDGTAEQSYFLNLLQGAPGYTAVEYALYAPDTIQGLAIQFARQVPSAAQKEFIIALYRDIAVNGGTDELIYSQDFQYPKYEDTVNHLSIYPFDVPQPLSAGAFYVAIIQPAGGGSDSLHIALDVNRTGANHRYYKVEMTWQPSLLDGALMLRPIVGPRGTLSIDRHENFDQSWSISPNPAHDFFRITVAEDEKQLEYSVYDISGKVLSRGSFRNTTNISVSGMVQGMYFVRLSGEKGSSVKKVIVQ